MIGEKNVHKGHTKLQHVLLENTKTPQDKDTVEIAQPVIHVHLVLLHLKLMSALQANTVQLEAHQELTVLLVHTIHHLEKQS